jgi:hypothetical protein
MVTEVSFLVIFASPATAAVAANETAKLKPNTIAKAFMA